VWGRQIGHPTCAATRLSLKRSCCELWGVSQRGLQLTGLRYLLWNQQVGQQGAPCTQHDQPATQGKEDTSGRDRTFKRPAYAPKYSVRNLLLSRQIFMAVVTLPERMSINGVVVPSRFSRFDCVHLRKFLYVRYQVFAEATIKMATFWHIAFIIRVMIALMIRADTSVTSVNFCQPTRRHNPEDSHPQC
jgi:hypothetical protein